MYKTNVFVTYRLGGLSFAISKQIELNHVPMMGINYTSTNDKFIDFETAEEDGHTSCKIYYEIDTGEFEIDISHRIYERTNPQIILETIEEAKKKEYEITNGDNVDKIINYLNR